MKSVRYVLVLYGSGSGFGVFGPDPAACSLLSLTCSITPAHTEGEAAAVLLLTHWG